MEWLIPVNEMLNDKITKLNYTLIPPGFHGDVRGVRVMQESLSKVIDILGEQSATAQGLSKVITTTEKLRNSPTHILYLLKDEKAKGGKGEVIGLLKVGRKHLFLFDVKDKVCEVEPLCVLDFFVLRDRQRHGYGKLLFDHMLQRGPHIARLASKLSSAAFAINKIRCLTDETIAKREPSVISTVWAPEIPYVLGSNILMYSRPLVAKNIDLFGKNGDIHHFNTRNKHKLTLPVTRLKKDMEVSAQALAIDGPSPKMEQFLKKNYDMECLLRQNNNFAVSPQFFGAVPEMSKSGRSTPVVTPALGRFAAPKPTSAIANVIHGGTNAYQETRNGTSSGVSPEAEVDGKAQSLTDKEPKPAPEVEETEAEIIEMAKKQKSPERPSTLHVEPVCEAAPSAPAISPAGSMTSRRDSQLTDRGYFDVKFYHNKLW